MKIAAANTVLPVTLADGYMVEAVLYAGDSLCLSSQVGCAMGCVFCASGRHGFYRNLSLDELYLQCHVVEEAGLAVKRITLSGIGEPLANFAPVRAFITENHTRGMAVSLTTTGYPLANFIECLHLPHNGLMLSLHSGTPGVHRTLLPHAPDYDRLWRSLADAWPKLSRGRRRRIGINYLLLAGVNDSEEEIGALAGRLAPFPEITLHLLACNDVEGSPCAGSARAHRDALYDFLVFRGINVRRANRWRQQQRGGCGTLFARRQEAGKVLQGEGVDEFHRGLLRNP